MDTHTYPGKGLSLSQLVFAINEELKRTANSPSFTFDAVSQLDRDISTTLANVREWRNSFVPINRVPLDVFSLIPTHLDSQPDRFRASRVCRHWRRILLQHASLWTRLILPKGEVYVEKLLERAKGSPLHVITSCGSPVGTITLLSPYAQQIKYLNFMYNCWTDVQRLSEVNSGALSLLHTLEINIIRSPSTDLLVPPSLPLFSNAVNLKLFVLRSEWSPFLNHFVFPNLTTFGLWTKPAEGFRASELLDFLEASPMLQTVRMQIGASILLEGVGQTRVVTLPNVQTFLLVVRDGRPGFVLAAHISCPSASETSLVHKKRAAAMTADQDIFPVSASWNTITRQYTTSPVEAVALDIETTDDYIIACTLTFQSSDTTILKLGFWVSQGILHEGDFEISLQDMVLEAVCQAFGVIRDHPLVSNIKRLRFGPMICLGLTFVTWDPEEWTRVATEVGRLFKSVRPLDELFLNDCDLRPYLTPFLDSPEYEVMEQPVAFPPIKELKISHPSMEDEHLVAAIVELAKSQHTLGVPFERMTIHAEKVPAAMAEMLRPWVGVVDC